MLLKNLKIIYKTIQNPSYFTKNSELIISTIEQFLVKLNINSYISFEKKL